MKVRDVALLSGAGLLATGGLFGWNIDGRWNDTVPALAAALLFALAGVRARVTPALIGLLALVFLNQRAPLEVLSLAICGLSLVAGHSQKTDDACRRVILVAAVPVLLFGIYQRYFLFPEIADQFSGAVRARLSSGRIFSFFMVPAQFSAWLAMILPLCAAALVDRNWRCPVLGRPARAILPLIGFSFYLAGSFSGIVAGFAAMAYLFGLRRLVPFAGVFVVIVGGLVLLRSDELLAMGPITMRLETWGSTLRGIFDAPLLGHGAGSFEKLYPAYYIFYGGDQVLHPHSWPLKIWFENGFLGVCAWAAIAASLFGSARDRSFRAAAIAFFIAALLDIADLSLTLRALSFFLLGASLPRRT